MALVARDSDIEGQLRVDVERLRALLGTLYFWVKELPVKHPQQGEAREQVRALLNIHKGGE